MVLEQVLTKKFIKHGGKQVWKMKGGEKKGSRWSLQKKLVFVTNPGGLSYEELISMDSISQESL